MRKLNLDQKRFLSDFLNGLAIAWFSAGVIAPLFTGFGNVLKLILQIISSVTVSVGLIFIGVRNLKNK